MCSDGITNAHTHTHTHRMFMGMLTEHDSSDDGAEVEI